MVFQKEFFERDDFEKYQHATKSMQMHPSINCKVNLGLFAGGWTRAIWFVGPQEPEVRTLYHF